jgi:urea carboxylase
VTLSRVLVANRGEIACRIISTLERLGIESVAVYSDADASAPHVAMATRAVRLGPPPPSESYLHRGRLLDALAATRCDGVHAGYGFLSESEAFAADVEAAGAAFIGPTPEQLRIFGEKHLARKAAERAGVPLAPGSGLLDDLDDARAQAAAIGYPVMLKAVAGGGGIGMAPCSDQAALDEAYERVRRQGETSFGSAAVFLERFMPRARHVEVQVFGDGDGRAVVLGDRDCSVQRRNQKVVEESPAPNLPEELRLRLHDAALALAEEEGYRSAGTVELLVDADTGALAFLELNARLQVEHPVTEAVWGIDLVEWMVRLAGGDAGPLDTFEQRLAGGAKPEGHAIEARIYAEDPARGYRPSPGLLTEVHLPDGPGIRVDAWVSTGTEVTAHYDPLLAKVVAHGPDRETARERLCEALAQTSVHGVETNLPLLRTVLAARWFRDGTATTGSLAATDTATATIEVRSAGTETTVQDHPGRLGRWDVGVPPSGPMDDRSFRLANLAVGNPAGTPGLEMAVTGPTLAFSTEAVVCLGGAPLPATVDGDPVPWWEPFTVPAGGVLAIGIAEGPGLRAYLALRGGLDVPQYLGSAATFTLGGFGGHGGRALVAGDVLRLAPPADDAPAAEAVPEDVRPQLGSPWEMAVLEGPHGDTEWFTPEDVDRFYAATWAVHHNSSRTGVRLVGPRPTWARPDGGEAGLHPSNIHDTAYAVGSVDFTGDMPIVLGPDGPSLGGFVCPAVVVAGDRWKLGQLRPGDEVHFVPVAPAAAHALASGATGLTLLAHRDPAGGVLQRLDPQDDRSEMTLRRSGDDHLLVEYGPMVLDLAVRLQVHTLMTWVQEQRLDGVIDITPGIRSLQLHVDPDRLSVERAAELVVAGQAELPATDDIEVPSRVVHLPLSWDDPSTREAIERYMTSVRPDAPWCPWNIEFIRRVNGLPDVDAVRRTVFDASYLVLGLGDVYLGAPVATPVDPRHRLVTTKYNPARTWTPENAVGIGGAYLCIYGMEGPGGYQFVGRTLQVWNRFRDTPRFRGDQRWLLRFFDQIRWHPVDPDELLDLRARFPDGRVDIEVEPSTFRLADHRQMLTEQAASIAAFRSAQQAAFATEREAWADAGEFDRADDLDLGADVGLSSAAPGVVVPPGGSVVEAPLAANVWQVPVEVGQVVAAGEVVVVLEAMKTEMALVTPVGGRVAEIVAAAGSLVDGGAPLVVLGPA